MVAQGGTHWLAINVSRDGICLHWLGAVGNINGLELLGKVAIDSVPVLRDWLPVASASWGAPLTPAAVGGGGCSREGRNCESGEAPYEGCKAGPWSDVISNGETHKPAKNWLYV